MGLESTTTIAGLDKTWPTSGDPRSQGDDHLRLIKDVLKTIFPGSGGNGFNIPIVATESELNFLAGVTSNIQAQINNTPLDQTSYTGADITLKLGQKAIWNVSSLTTLALRVDPADGIYRLNLYKSNPGSGGANISGTYLRPNNAVLGSNLIHREQTSTVNAVSVSPDSISENAFALAPGGTLQNTDITIRTAIDSKMIIGSSKALSVSEHRLAHYMTYWNDTTTDWSSLGTIAWAAAWSGLVTLERVF